MPEDRLLVVVPSRGRPQNIQQLLETWESAGTSYALTDLMVITDDDDETRHDYPIVPYDVGWHETGPRLRLGPTLNKVVLAEAKRYSAIGFMGDDHRPRTVGWDSKIRQSIADGATVVYGDDLVHGIGLPTAAFIAAPVLETLGYMVPPGAIHLFLDNFWLALGQRLGIQYRSDMIIEHVHPITKKAEWDATYVEVNSAAMWSHDEEVFNRYMREQFETDMVKVEESRNGSQAVR